MTDLGTYDTYVLLRMLGSRTKRMEEWKMLRSHARWPRAESEYDDSDDEIVMFSVSDELARRIDAGRKEQT